MEDLTGKRFGRWTIVKRAPDKITQSGYRNIMWHCVCDCGNEKIVRGKSLVYGVSRSCGCLQKEELSDRASKHHGFGTRLYSIWNSMRQRCNNQNHRAFCNYGGRGIKVCNEWDDFAAFRDWAYESGYRDDAARGELTLDRIDVNGDYSPENCRFADMKQQAENRRDSIIVEHNGECHPLTVWAEIVGENYTTLWQRYNLGRPIFRD